MRQTKTDEGEFRKMMNHQIEENLKLEENQTHE